MSYSCLPNIGVKILANTAQKYKGPTIQNPQNDCINHRRGQNCPVEGNICNRINNINNSEIKCDTISYNYIGMSAPPLRLRVATHIQSLKNTNSKNQTELSKKCKELASENIKYDIIFKLIENKPTYTPERKKCDLCISESYHILFSSLENIINKKSEITNKCRHRSRFKIGAI